MINDVLEEYGDAALLNILVTLGLVDQITEFIKTDLLGALAKNEKHRVNDVRFATSIRTNYSREALQIQE